MPSQNPQLAAGGVVWRPAAGGPEVLLVHRPRYDDWSFPKGKLDAGENSLQAASREVSEETGLEVRLGPALGTIEYDLKRRKKSVRYWSMRLEPGSDSTPHPMNLDEVDDFCWVALDRATERLSYPDDSLVLRRFSEVGQANIGLVLVRHAHAGSRHAWNGDDDDRRLDAQGTQQAAQIAATVGVFKPNRVLTAPLVRCRDTVQSLADRVRLPLEHAGFLADKSSERQPAQSTAKIRVLADESGPVVACSQGETIERASAAMLPSTFGPFDCKKGGFWAIGTVAGHIATADYYPTLRPER